MSAMRISTAQHLLLAAFGLVTVVDDAAHVPVDVVRVTDIQKPKRLTIPSLSELDRP